MAKKDGMYSDYRDRKAMEARDAGMISEDRSAIANLPQDVMFKEYAPVSYDHYDLNDNVHGVDVQMKDDAKKGQRKYGERYPEKY